MEVEGLGASSRNCKDIFHLLNWHGVIDGSFITLFCNTFINFNLNLFTNNCCIIRKQTLNQEWFISGIRAVWINIVFAWKWILKIQSKIFYYKFNYWTSETGKIKFQSMSCGKIYSCSKFLMCGKSWKKSEKFVRFLT